jgi:intracellular multiplication protein IcmO
MLASGLGDKVEGDYRDVIETKPTNAKTPYLCILDEYGYYAVKGFAVVPAQARSLGFSVVFAGQDLPAFEKASKEEAASICANTNIKICMKLEDPKETWEFFNKTAGEAYVSVAKSYNMNNQSATGLSYRDSMEAQLDKRARLDLLDLKDQREGDAHIFFKSQIVRAKMFYANPPKVQKIKLNQFMKVKGPSDQAVKQLKQLRSAVFKQELLDRAGMDEPLSALFEIYDSEVALKRSTLMQSLSHYIEGRQEVEEVSFGDQSDNASIFMRVPVEQRLQSTYFDVEISLLQDSILTKEKLYEVVKRLAILEGKSESYAKQASMEVINLIERETDYARCLPKFMPGLIDRISQYEQKIGTS